MYIFNNLNVILRLLKSRFFTLIIILRGQPLILNYQMGKVGSSSIAEYLKQNNIHEWHIHRFYNSPVHDKKKKNIFTYILDLALLHMAIRRCKKIYVITGFREPVARDISMFFHSFEKTKYDPNLSITQLEKIFRSKFDVGKSVDWFEMEFNKAFKINIYDYPYNCEEGYVSFRRGNLSFFIYDMSSLNTLENQIGEFLEIDEYQLIRANLSSNKPYRERYKKFITQFSIEDHEFLYIVSSKFVKHFFCTDELQSKIRGWKKNK